MFLGQALKCALYPERSLIPKTVFQDQDMLNKTTFQPWCPLKSFEVKCNFTIKHSFVSYHTDPFFFVHDNNLLMNYCLCDTKTLFSTCRLTAHPASAVPIILQGNMTFKGLKHALYTSFPSFDIIKSVVIERVMILLEGQLLISLTMLASCSVICQIFRNLTGD